MSLYVNTDNGDYYAMVDGVWVLQGNLRDFVHNPNNRGSNDPGVNDSAA